MIRQLTSINIVDNSPQITNLPTFSGISSIAISFLIINGHGNLMITVQQAHIPGSWQAIGDISIHDGFTSGTALVTGVNSADGAVRIVTQTTGDLQARIKIT